MEEGFDLKAVNAINKELESRGAMMEVVSSKLGAIKSSDGNSIEAEKSYATTESVLYDAVFVPGGDQVDNMRNIGKTVHFIQEAYRHFKPIGSLAEANELVKACIPDELNIAEKGVVSDKGVVTGIDPDTMFLTELTNAIAMHRHYQRNKELVPA